ncbi:hypothetical protein HC928_15200, partial [bacterium]|nr:hypothetical protein [bacterium]
TTYEEVWRTVLINTDETGDWNYPGVVSVLANGDLYVIFGYQIARINAQTGEVIQQEVLPVIAPARDTSYNGFTVLRDGTIIAKTVSRETGCELQGFSAFLQCPNPQNVPTSLMVAIDPETLDVIAQIPVAEPAFGRITSTHYNGVDYIYLAGFDNLFRYTFGDDNTFMFDEAWGFVPYRMEGQTGGTAIAVMNDWVVVQTNSTPSRMPLSVMVASQSDSTITYRLDPFADSPNPISFIPSMLTVDPENNRIYAQDAGAGRVAALDFDPEHGLTVAWMVEQTTLHFTTLVGPESARVLVATDVPGFSLSALGNGEAQMENVVWRDAETGMELARSGDLPPMTSGVLVTPGYAGRFYYLGLAGDIFELYPQQFIAQSASEESAGTNEEMGYRAGLYDTAFPTDRADLNGGKTGLQGGFPRGTTVDDVAVELIEMPYPVILYTREPDEIFVFGGTPLGIEDYVSRADGLPAGENETTPYFAKYNPNTGGNHLP